MSILFYTTLGYGLVRNYFLPNKHCWYNRVDDNLIVGAIPFRSMIEQLKSDENVGGIICCNQEFELKSLSIIAKQEDWEAASVPFHHIPMKDFIGTTTMAEIQRAMEFIDKIRSTGKTVYLHCKAGRTRSASIATCYLMYHCNLTLDVAYEMIKVKRPKAYLYSPQWRMANQWQKYRDNN